MKLDLKVGDKVCVLGHIRIVKRIDGNSTDEWAELNEPIGKYEECLIKKPTYWSGTDEWFKLGDKITSWKERLR